MTVTTWKKRFLLKKNHRRHRVLSIQSASGVTPTWFSNRFPENVILHTIVAIGKKMWGLQAARSPIPPSPNHALLLGQGSNIAPRQKLVLRVPVAQEVWQNIRKIRKIGIDSIIRSVFFFCMQSFFFCLFVCLFFNH